MKSLLAAAAGAALLCGSAAGAATVSVQAIVPDAALANPAPSASGTVGGGTGGPPALYDNVTGDQSLSGTVIARDPWAGTALEGDGLYSSVNRNAFVQYDFAELQRSVTLVWGSPEPFNSLMLARIVGGSVATISGSLIAETPVAAGEVRQVTISGVAFDRMLLSSTENAFEFGNLTAVPIPLPASVWLLLGGLAGLGWLGRRRAAA